MAKYTKKQMIDLAIQKVLLDCEIIGKAKITHMHKEKGDDDDHCVWETSVTAKKIGELKVVYVLDYNQGHSQYGYCELFASISLFCEGKMVHYEAHHNPDGQDAQTTSSPFSLVEGKWWIDLAVYDFSQYPIFSKLLNEKIGEEELKKAGYDFSQYPIFSKLLNEKIGEEELKKARQLTEETLRRELLMRAEEQFAFFIKNKETEIMQEFISFKNNLAGKYWPNQIKKAIKDWPNTVVNKYIDEFVMKNNEFEQCGLKFNYRIIYILKSFVGTA